MERLVRGRWRPYTDDLGLQIIWRVDDEGRYTAEWEVPLDAPRADLPLPRHRQPLRDRSREFGVVATNDLEAVVADGRVRLRYPARRADVAGRPFARRLVVASASASKVRRGRLRLGRDPARRDRIEDGDARDAYGNTAAGAVALAVSEPARGPRIEVTPERARELVDRGEALVVDVREPYEREAGHIEGSRHIELERLAATPRRCRATARSSSSAASARAAPSPRARSAAPATTRGHCTAGCRLWHDRGLPMKGEVADH